MPNIEVKKAIRFVNVGEDPPNPREDFIGMRQWEACRKYGFLSAGQGVKFSSQLNQIEVEDIVAAYISGHGYVGIGIVKETSKPITDFRFDNRIFNELNIEQDYIDDINHDQGVIIGLEPLRKSLFRNCLNENSEYVIKVEWKIDVSLEQAIWKTNAGLFAKPMVTCSLANQDTTLRFLEAEWNFVFKI